jgi:hypothetical protein
VFYVLHDHWGIMCNYKRGRGRGIIAETIAKKILVSTMCSTGDSLLRFTVTRPVTNREVPKVVAPRGTRLAFGKIFVKEGRRFQSCLPMIADSRGHRPDCPLGNALKTAEGP